MQGRKVDILLVFCFCEREHWRGGGTREGHSNSESVLAMLGACDTSRWASSSKRGLSRESSCSMRRHGVGCTVGRAEGSEEVPWQSI